MNILVRKAYILSLLFIMAFATASQAKPFVVGKVSDNPKKHYRYLKPMADYLAEKLKDHGYSEGRVLMTKNNQQMIEYLRQGRVDLVTETLLSAVEFQDRAGAEIILLKWKKGTPTYHSVIFARKDSGIDKPLDLLGKVIAFEDAGSTSAFYLPAAELIGAGLKLVALPSPRDRPNVGKLGYVFSGEEINTSIMVHKSIVDAGAFNDHDWNKEDHLPRRLQRGMKVIHRSKPVPRAVELVPRSMNPEIKQKIKELLLAAPDDASAKGVLYAYQRTTKFEELGPDFDKQIEYARKVLTLVKQELQIKQ